MDLSRIHFSRGAPLAKRDSFLIRIDPKILAAIRKWSEDEMRSMNGQIEYLLRQSLAKAGRLRPEEKTARDDAESDS